MSLMSVWLHTVIHIPSCVHSHINDLKRRIEVSQEGEGHYWFPVVLPRPWLGFCSWSCCCIAGSKFLSCGCKPEESRAATRTQFLKINTSLFKMTPTYSTTAHVYYLHFSVVGQDPSWYPSSVHYWLAKMLTQRVWCPLMNQVSSGFLNLQRCEVKNSTTPQVVISMSALIYPW